MTTKVEIGPRGGKYYVSKSGEKIYGDPPKDTKAKAEHTQTEKPKDAYEEYLEQKRKEAAEHAAKQAGKPPEAQKPKPKTKSTKGTNKPKTGERPKWRHGGHDEVDAHGGNGDKAHDLIMGFRGDVFHPKGLEFKGAVAKAFKVDAAQDADRLARLVQAHEKRQPYRDPKKANLSGAREHVAERLEAGSSHVATVAAIARVSQSKYEDSHVTVFRGITGKQAQEIIEAHKRGGGPVNIRTDTTSSFTEDHGIAQKFAREGSTRLKASPHAVVVKMRVPRESIVASHRAFRELESEKEVVIASHGGHSIDLADIQIIAGG